MKNTIKKIFSELIEFLWYKKFSFYIFFTLLTAFVAVIEPVFFALIIEFLEEFYTTKEFDIQWFTNMLVLWVVFIIFTLIVSYIHRYYVTDLVSINFHRYICKKYVKDIFYMTNSEYLWKKTWAIYKKFDRWSWFQFQFIFWFFKEFLRNIFWLIVILIVMMTYSVKMTLIAISCLPIMIIFWVYFAKVTTKKQQENNKKWDKAYSVIWNFLSSFSLWKILNLEKSFLNTFNDQINESNTLQRKISKSWSVADIYTAILIMISRILVLWFWVYYIYIWEITLTVLFLIFAYIWWIYFPLSFLFWSLRNIQEWLVWIDDFYKEFWNIDSEDTKTWTKLTNVKWKIEFRNVWFSYNNQREILKNVSFTVSPWEKISFVWNTWAWKSTIINLLFRFWDNSSWEILLDGKNISKYTKKSIRKNIWLVMQDSTLFNDTIKQNLLYAKPDATKKELDEALKLSESEFVYNLEDGIDTVIWERWLKLSWWEKQRLNIARLFLKNPKILILDEATSALDNKTEKQVQKALDNLMKNRTSIVVAHRLSTIQNADKIFMLEDWKIIESWTYEDLMNKKSSFYSLANPEHLIIN